MIAVKTLRNKEGLGKIPNDKPGYYKWWASEELVRELLAPLNADFDKVNPHIEKKEGLYCIYVGIAVKESIRSRLNWHINDRHDASAVRCGALSTLRQSISSIVANNQYDKEATNNFLDKLFVEYFEIDLPIKSEEAKAEIHDIEKRLMQEKLYILNIQDNKHPEAKSIKKELKKLRKNSR